MFRVLETFSITGRGTVVVLDQASNLPIGRKLTARVTRPDGSILKAVSFKEWLLRRNPDSREGEAFLLRDIEKSEVPDGSLVAIELEIQSTSP